MHTTGFRLARVAVVLGLAIGGYLLFIRTSHVDRQLLRNLVIQRTQVPGLRARPSLSQSIKPSSSTFKVVKDAAKSDPGSTGIYEIEWTSSNKSLFEAGILFQLLPDSQKAHTTLVDSEKQFGSKPQLTGENLAPGTSFAVSGVPGADANSYAMTDSSSGAASGYAYTVVYQTGRAVVTELLEWSNTTLSTAPADSIARSERSLLLRSEPGFSLVHTPTPVISTIVYVAVALVLAVGAYFVPEWAIAARARRRARHEEKERERARSQYRARGRRAVRRHRAPAWRQPRRR